MNCHNCGKENRGDSIFCRHCGAQLKQGRSKLKRLALFEKKARKIWIIVGVIILISGGTAYAAPKVNDYIAIRVAIGNANKYQEQGDYSDAIAAINTVEGRWTLPSDQRELDTLKNQEAAFVQDQNNFNLAVSESNTSTISSSTITDAENLLESIDSDYPQYDKVQSEITSLQAEATNQLENETLQAQDQAQAAEAEKAQADAQAATAEAQATQAAKDKASAEAASAAAAQAQEEANAQAEAQAAAAQQAQANAAHQVRVSFYNQLLSIYQAVNNDGITYYSEAVNDYNDDEDLSAIAEFGQAQAIFQTAYNNSSNLSNGFSGLTSDYLMANQDMTSAADDCLEATNLMITGIGGDVDNTSLANLDADDCNSIKASVETFLNETTP